MTNWTEKKYNFETQDEKLNQKETNNNWETQNEKIFWDFYNLLNTKESKESYINIFESQDYENKIKLIEIIKSLDEEKVKLLKNILHNIDEESLKWYIDNNIEIDLDDNTLSYFFDQFEVDFWENIDNTKNNENIEKNKEIEETIEQIKSLTENEKEKKYIIDWYIKLLNNY